MPHFQIAVEIAAPPQRVWAVLMDVERWPEWTPTVTNVERLDPGPLSLGSRTRIRQPKLRPAVWQITELAEKHGVFTWVSSSPGVQVTACHAVEATAAGSRATLSTEFSGLLGLLMARLFRQLNEQYVTTEAQGLKRRCEA
jgi:uncharacterized membrane protein